MSDKERRMKQYGCDGECNIYNDEKEPCPYVDVCPETSMDSGVGCVAAFMMIIMLLILPVVAIIILIAIFN